MKYVTTNLRLPEPLWAALKQEALRRRVRLAEVIREKLGFKKSDAKASAVRGLWSKTTISEKDFKEARGQWKSKFKD